MNEALILVTSCFFGILFILIQGQKYVPYETQAAQPGRAMQAKNKWLNILATQEQELELAEDLTDVQGSSIVGGTTVTRGRVASSAQGVVGR